MMVSKKHFLLYRTAGLGNQFYYLAYCDYLKHCGFKTVKLLNVGPKKYGDTKDRTKRNLILEIPEKLDLQRVNLIGRIYLVLLRMSSWPFYEQFWSKFFRLHQEDDLAWSKFVPIENLKLAKYNIHIGSFQSYHYISNDFIKGLSSVVDDFNRQLVYSITKDDVAIHIRRGDFLTFGAGQIYNIISGDYYLKGLEYLKSKNPINRIYIFSDDFENIKEEITLISDKYKDVFLVENQTVMEDLNTLRQFTNYILSNSTFSWWGAILSCNKNANVIVPKTPWKKGMENASPYFPSWIQIEN